MYIIGHRQEGMIPALHTQIIFMYMAAVESFDAFVLMAIRSTMASLLLHLK